MKGPNENYPRGLGKWQNHGPGAPRKPLHGKGRAQIISWFACDVLLVRSNYRMPIKRPTPARAGASAPPISSAAMPPGHFMTR